MFPLVTKLKSKLLSKGKSKKGYTLVEALAACFVIMIIFTGVLNSVAFAQRLVYSNNSKEKASDTAQLVADELISVTRGMNDLTEAETAISDSKIFDSTDEQYSVIGDVQEVTAFTEPDATHKTIQYILDYQTAADTDVSTDIDGATVSGTKVQQDGVVIYVRVYYKRFSNSATYDAVDLTAFAPKAYNTI